MGPCSQNGSRETNQTNPGTGALRWCKYLWETSTTGPGISRGAGSTTMCIYRQFIDMALRKEPLAMFRKNRKKKKKRLLGGEFREFTRGWEPLTLQSCKFEARLLPAANTWSPLRERWQYLRPWALTTGKPKPGVCELALTRWYWKGNTVLWTWEERVCCFSVKAGASDCPTANSPRGHWFTISSFGLGLAASLTDKLPRQQARLVPCCNVNQTKPCSDTDYVFPQQACAMD